MGTIMPLNEVPNHKRKLKRHGSQDSSSVRSAMKKDAPVVKTDINVTWDEKAIAEHDKLRGTRQIIEEPDTPFVKYASIDSEEISDLDLGTGAATNLGAAYENRHKNAGIEPVDLNEVNKAIVAEIAEAKAGEEEKKRQIDFRKKRSAHYNEFQKVKEMREKMARGELDEDE